jgi:ADP-heptose:LPS heptosyltransferase
MNNHPRLLLLYARSDALGDGLLRIPALRAARAAFPEAHIVYATARDTSLGSVLHRHVRGSIDEVRTGRSIPRLLAEFAPRRGEAAVADFRTVVGWLVGERLRLLPRGVTYEANFPGYALSALARGFGIRPAHNAWRYHRLIERLAGRPLTFDHRITPLDAAREEARRICGPGTRPLVVLGANSAPHKALTSAQLVPVARALLDRGFDVIHVHSPGSGPTGLEMLEAVPDLVTIGPADVHGIPLLEMLLALGELADAYMGPEGGLGHLLAAVGTPVVVLNHGASMERWRPLNGVIEVVEARHASPTGRPADIPASAIVAALDRLMLTCSRNLEAGGRLRRSVAAAKFSVSGP